jgi:3-hydroxyacyl-CoA dehydrogenase/enoyl-CoA hydratase/3-hydroxybutyryl-CoA epimerase/enoyl-CoA isomerase
MEFQGQSLQVKMLDGGIAELIFDLQGESVNKFDRQTVEELKAVGDQLAAAGDIKGLLVSSAKGVFIVGADITEFGESFALSDEELLDWCAQSNAIFCTIEDLPFPSVTAINGIAFGGGLEMALATDYRVMADNTQIGLPEVKLGIIPGFGGTVRLPRLIGADNAIEWIASGTPQKADSALKNHAVDAVVAVDQVRASALSLLNEAIAGKFDWKARRAMKTGKLNLNMIEQMMVFETAKGFIAGQAGKNYPAPLTAVKSMQKGAGKDRDGALKHEHEAFVKVAKTPVAQSLIGLFLNDQLLKKKAKTATKAGHPVKQGAVLGAGIMGGGIAYQSASKGTPIIMKDIKSEQLELGLSEANKLLAKLVSRGKIDAVKMGKALANIRATLNYGDFADVDIVVEAVVENPKVKQAVLAEVETQVKDTAILASNTSTISISFLAQALKRPENFCGMHFFNPVHKMPLVEVIRGEKSSDVAVATTVAYAAAMGKTPIVVNDCPGFLVNRILFPYFAGFQGLMNEGADFRQVDKVMEGFGWPMGPAYLLDVVGIDTAHHAQAVMAEGYPDRMASTQRSSLDVMYEETRYGQKNGKGYYVYELDKKGRLAKVFDEAVPGMLASVRKGDVREFEAQEISERLMIPMIIETARCLEEHIVETPNEADMGLILGIGFPPFRGGALKYADALGMQAVLDMAAKYAHLGKLYEPTARMREMAANGETYYG